MKKKVKLIKTKTYLDSLYRLRDNSVIVQIEKKVNSLLDNPGLAKPMKYQHQGFCELRIGSSYRVYCIKLEETIVVFILGSVIHHKKNYQKSKEYSNLFSDLDKLKKEFKDNSN